LWKRLRATQESTFPDGASKLDDRSDSQPSSERWSLRRPRCPRPMACCEAASVRWSIDHRTVWSVKQRVRLRRLSRLRSQRSANTAPRMDTLPLLDHKSRGTARVSARGSHGTPRSSGRGSSRRSCAAAVASERMCSSARCAASSAWCSVGSIPDCGIARFEAIQAFHAQSPFSSGHTFQPRASPTSTYQTLPRWIVIAKDR
jgi:hypothetical protein